MAGRTSRDARLIAAAQSILRTGSAESEWRRLLDCDPGQLGLFEATLLAAALSDPQIAPGSTPRFAQWLRYKQQRLVYELKDAGLVEPREALAASATITAAWPETGSADEPG